MRLSYKAIAAFLLVGLPGLALADEVLHRYEGDVMPSDPSAGWIADDPCINTCNEFLEDGHFIFWWAEGGDQGRYGRWIAQAPQAPPFDVDRVALPFQSSAGSEFLYLRRVVHY